MEQQQVHDERGDAQVDGDLEVDVVDETPAGAAGLVQGEHVLADADAEQRVLDHEPDRALHGLPARVRRTFGLNICDRLDAIDEPVDVQHEDHEQQDEEKDADPSPLEPREIEE